MLIEDDHSQNIEAFEESYNSQSFKVSKMETPTVAIATRLEVALEDAEDPLIEMVDIADLENLLNQEDFGTPEPECYDEGDQDNDTIIDESNESLEIPRGRSEVEVEEEHLVDNGEGEENFNEGIEALNA